MVFLCAAILVGCQNSTGASSPRPEHALAGFTAYVGPGDPAGVRHVESTLDDHFQLATDFLDDRSWSSLDDDQWDLARWQGSGFRMVFGVPMLPRSAGVSLAIGATGAYDGYFTSLAHRLVSAGMGDAILRLGWEFNESSNPWYAAGQAPAFVRYWRDIVTSMRSVPGARFSFMWNPDRGDLGGGDAAVGDLADYFPGSRYVDVVGLDVYDSSWNSYPGAAQEFQTIVTQSWGLDWLASFGRLVGRPVAIPECGLGNGPSARSSGPIRAAGPVSGGDDPVFVHDVATWSVEHDSVVTAFWDGGPTGILNGREPRAAAELLSFVRTVHNARDVRRANPGA